GLRVEALGNVPPPVLLSVVVRRGCAVRRIYRRRTYSLVDQLSLGNFELAAHTGNHRALLPRRSSGGTGKGPVEKRCVSLPTPSGLSSELALLNAQLFLRLPQVAHIDVFLWRRWCSFDDAILYLHLDVYFQSGKGHVAFDRIYLVVDVVIDAAARKGRLKAKLLRQKVGSIRWMIVNPPQGLNVSLDEFPHRRSILLRPGRIDVDIVELIIGNDFRRIA